MKFLDFKIKIRIEGDTEKINLEKQIKSEELKFNTNLTANTKLRQFFLNFGKIYYIINYFGKFIFFKFGFFWHKKSRLEREWGQREKKSKNLADKTAQIQQNTRDFSQKLVELFQFLDEKLEFSADVRPGPAAAPQHDDLPQVLENLEKRWVFYNFLKF